MERSISVLAKMQHPNETSMDVSITPTDLTLDGEDVLYFYVVYDLCEVTTESRL